jgi:hypothetical protein
MVRVRTHKEQPWIAACVWCNDLPEGIEIERRERPAAEVTAEAGALELIREFAHDLRDFLNLARESVERHHATCGCPLCALSRYLWPVYASVAEPGWMKALLPRLSPLTLADWREVKALLMSLLRGPRMLRDPARPAMLSPCGGGPCVYYGHQITVLDEAVRLVRAEAIAREEARERISGPTLFSDAA